MNSPRNTAQEGAHHAQHSEAHNQRASVGFVILGAVYAFIGWLAFRISRGGNSEEASNSGALQLVAETPGGRIALWVAVVGLIAPTFWRIAQLMFKPEAKQRLKAVGPAVVYLTLAFTAAKAAMGKPSSDSKKTTSVTATVLENPFGVYTIARARYGDAD